jgi:3D (Asp-Asp-Asp) domain-containing protein
MRRTLARLAARGCAVALAAAAVACASPSDPGLREMVRRSPAPAAVPRGEAPAPSPAPKPAPPGFETRALAVKASAYNSVRSQADSTPTVTAFGVRLRPGMRTIAVSRDLEALGLKRGTVVRIDELPGEWRVADRMGKRWTRTIDLYFGLDVRAAREWGRRNVTVRWDHPVEPDLDAQADGE